MKVPQVLLDHGAGQGDDPRVTAEFWKHFHAASSTPPSGRSDQQGSHAPVRVQGAHWETIKRAFVAASDHSVADRVAVVARECGDDSKAAREVMRLLEVEGRAAGFLTPPDRTAPPSEFFGPPPRQLGDFELQEQLGRGGMGLVYRAWQHSLGRTVAVKVLPRSLTLTERQIDRFRREAKAIARLAHPGIVSIITVGEKDGSYYFAMELVEGHDLAVELRRLREQRWHEKGEPTTLPSSTSSDYCRAVAKIARDAADALAYAHEHGIVHRDVKPSNLLLDANAHVKLVDFGLARDVSQGSMTHSGEFAGTPHYMSPEQARARLHQVDHRTDVYSLGVVLFELLTLERPFEASTHHEVLSKILENAPPRIRRLNQAVPRDLETICSTAMAKDPRHRYASAAELRDDLQRFLDGQSILARSPSLALRAARFSRRHCVAIGVALIFLVGVSAGASITAFKAKQHDLRNHLASAIAIAGTGALADVEPARLVELAQHLHALRELESDLPEADRTALKECGSRLEAVRDRWIDEAWCTLGVAGDISVPTDVRDSARLRALQVMLMSARVFGEDAELEELAVRAASETSLMNVAKAGGAVEGTASLP